MSDNDLTERMRLQYEADRTAIASRFAPGSAGDEPGFHPLLEPLARAVANAKAAGEKFVALTPSSGGLVISYALVLRIAAELFELDDKLKERRAPARTTSWTPAVDATSDCAGRA